MKKVIIYRRSLFSLDPDKQTFTEPYSAGLVSVFFIGKAIVRVVQYMLYGHSIVRAHVLILVLFWGILPAGLLLQKHVLLGMNFGPERLLSETTQILRSSLTLNVLVNQEKSS